jgi:hypothetical protein
VLKFAFRHIGDIETSRSRTFNVEGKGPAAGGTPEVGPA